VLPFAEAVAQRVYLGQAPHNWHVRPQRLGRRAGIIASSKPVSHRVHLEGICATASTEHSDSDERPVMLDLPERFRDRGSCRLLAGADGLSAAAVLPVRMGDLVCEVDDEALVLVELLRCHLALEQRDCVAQMPERVLLELIE
jgi:hypothetical protein